jgi:hypothetical protein
LSIREPSSLQPSPEFHTLPADYNGHNLVFIVGCPRSGTTWLQSLVASHPLAHTGRESHLFDWYLGPLIRHWNQELEIRDVGLGNYFREDEFHSLVRNFTLQLLAPMALSLQEGELFVEKTPGHGLYLQEISEMLPQSRYLHILRDGRDVTASMLAASKSWASSWAPRDARNAARTWVKSVTTIREAARSLPSGRFLEVRYEELWNDPRRILSEVMEFLGLKWNDQEVNEAIRRNDARASHGGRTPIKRGGAYSGRGGSEVKKNEFIRRAVPGGWKTDLSWSDKIWFWRIARKTMDEVGYECRYPW